MRIALVVLCVVVMLQVQQGEPHDPLSLALITGLLVKTGLTKWLLRNPEPAR